MNIETQRAAFEAWYASKFALDSYLRFTFDESRNQYEAPFLDYMWSAYQAALESPEVQALRKDAQRWQYTQQKGFFECGDDSDGYSVGVLKYKHNPRAEYSDPPYMEQLPLNQCIEGYGETLKEAVDAAMEKHK